MSDNNKNNPMLRKLFNLDWDAENVLSEFAADTFEEREKRADAVYEELCEYLLQNKRYWRKISGLDKKERQARSCTIEYDFKHYDELQKLKIEELCDNVDDIGLFLNEDYKEKTKTFRAAFTVNSVTESIDIYILYFGMTVIPDEKEMMQAANEYNHSSHKMGIFSYDRQNKMIGYTTNICYSACNSVKELLDKRLAVTLAAAYEDFYISSITELRYEADFFMLDDNAEAEKKPERTDRLELFFNGEFSLEKAETDFYAGELSKLIDKADEAYNVIRKYAENNSRFWSRITPDDEAHAKRRACAVFFDYHIKTREEDGLTIISRDKDYTSDSEINRHGYHTMFLIFPAAQCIEILTSYTAQVTDSSEDDVYKVLSDITNYNERIIWGKLMYSVKRKRVSHWARLSYANADSVYKLLDNHVPKILAEAVVFLDKVADNIPMRKMTMDDFLMANPDYSP